jgi:indole-3-acetate monooxygenase
MGDAGAPQPVEWLDRARCLAPLIEKHRDDGERDRSLPKPVFEELRQTGLLDLWKSNRYGGYEVDNETSVRVVEQVARFDGAVGWNLLILGAGGLFASYLPPDTADEIFDDAVVAGSFAPNGQAIPVPGGHRVTGRWSFASGCQQANWFIAGALTMQDGRPRLLPEGRPEIQLHLLPAADCQILDTWHTAGMRGTGSHDFEAEEVFVPSDRRFPFDDLFRSPRHDPTRPPFHHVALPGLAAVGLGIARDAIDTFTSAATTKTPRGGTSTLLGYHTVHEKVGRAEAVLGSARAYLLEAVRSAASGTDRDSEQMEETTALVRLASTHAAQSAAEVASLMFTAGGGSAVYATSRLERCFRDANTVTHHAMIQSLNYEMVGQYLLGLGLRMRR